MKNVLISTGLCLFSVIAWAGERVDQTIAAASDGYVEIEHLNGYAKIVGWDRSDVRVTGELGERTDEFVFERSGNEVTIEVKVKRQSGRWGGWGDGDGDNLEIFVPMKSKVSYTSTNANVDIMDIGGGASVETVNGNIDAETIAGRVTLSSVNGDIKSKNLSADKLVIETVNGDISDRDSSAERANYDSVNGDVNVQSNLPNLHIETVNGDMELVLLQAVEDLEMQAVNGSIDATIQLDRRGSVRASTVGGSVDLRFQDDVSARFDIEAHAGGRITNNLTNDREQKAKYGPSRWLEFSVNGGEAKVDVSTVSGRVRLNKR